MYQYAFDQLKKYVAGGGGGGGDVQLVIIYLSYMYPCQACKVLNTKYTIRPVKAK